jgi:hypothetical protein
MPEYDLLIIVIVALSMVSFLLYGRARAYGVAPAVARRAIIEIWVAAAATLTALTIAVRLVPAARVAPWGVLNADPRGRAIAIATGIFCLAATLYALGRVRTIMDAGRPPELGDQPDDDSSEDEDS